uniref:hypothetical protein n=1 Tax=Pandoraea pnomenusa TaxID=93220 RepID=UPI0011868EE2|nr:hypothetical protein [Pandoraea pnomenusa]
MVKIRTSTHGDNQASGRTSDDVRANAAAEPPPTRFAGRPVKVIDEVAAVPRAAPRSVDTTAARTPARFSGTASSRSAYAPQDLRRRMGYLQCQMIQSCLKHSGRLMATNLALTEPRFVELLSEARASEALTVRHFHRITRRQVAGLPNGALSALVQVGSHVTNGPDSGIMPDAMLNDIAQDRVQFEHLILRAIFSAGIDSLDERLCHEKDGARQQALDETRNARRQIRQGHISANGPSPEFSIGGFGVRLRDIWHHRFIRLRPLIEAVLAHPQAFEGRDALPIALSASLLNDPSRAVLHGRALRVLSGDAPA